MATQSFSEGAFLRALLNERDKSTCKDKHVAAALTMVDSRSSVPTVMAYSLAHNVPQNDLCQVECPKLKGASCQALHAEVAAIKQSPGVYGLREDFEVGVSPVMWVTHWPCFICLQAIQRTGVQSLYIVQKSDFADGFNNWIAPYAERLNVQGEPKPNWITTSPKQAQGLTYQIHTCQCKLFGMDIRVFSYEDNLESWEKTMDLIRDYHIRLGSPDLHANKMQQAREIILSLHQEVAEMANTVQWKPWKRGEGVCDEWLLEETSDVIFFLDSWLMLHGKSWKDLQEATQRKIAENHKRINANTVIAKKD